MLNIPLLLLFGSVALGGLFSLNLFIPKSERNIQLDLWLSLGMTSIIVYKLFPLLYEPTLILRPMDLLLQNAGVQGVILAALSALALFFWGHRRQKARMYNHFFALTMVFLIAYGLYGLLMLNMYRGLPLFIFKGLIGLLIPLLLWRYPRSDYVLLPLAAGGIVWIEMIVPAVRWYGLSLIQWAAVLAYAILLVLSWFTGAREERHKRL
ncbi:MAG: hypothetical protein RBR24_05955 [Candidatus Carbobacillus sp.]|nr:hypothetical protein [Candidatus Carbobacillus sp.]